LDKVNEIERASFSSPWPLSFFDHLHEKNPELFLVAEINGQIVGFVIGEIRQILLRGIPLLSKVGHIMNLVVDEKWRKRGVGTLLMGKIEENFRGKHSTKAILEVRESNTEARRFYKSNGYSEMGRVKSYYFDEDAVIMSKPM
jgi:ribosomal-protein-alanine N-acetyltransferase